ncbi:MAG: hypothetical protein IKV82_07515 [Akkermansia sp.]|nr:hypothetical protein [Akkermansia sp.]
MKFFNTEKLTQALRLLDEQLILSQSQPVELVVCGGSALIACHLVNRTTQDVDVVALMKDGQLVSAEPLPDELLCAVQQVAAILQLPDDWLNNGPASQLSMGLPPGLAHRLQASCVGEKLTIYYIARQDQVYFKLFAAVDRGGYHIQDLKALHPTDDEIFSAAQWCMEQDISEGFRFLLKELLTHIGWKHVGEQI